MFFASTAVAIVLYLLTAWNRRNADDLGIMSQDWLAEFNAAHS